MSLQVFSSPRFQEFVTISRVEILEKSGRASVSPVVCVNVLICLTKVFLAGEKEEALTCSTCWFLWYKYIHRDQFQAANMIVPERRPGSDADGRLSRAGMSWLRQPWPWHSFCCKLWSLGSASRRGIFRKKKCHVHDAAGAGRDSGSRVELCPPPFFPYIKEQNKTFCECRWRNWHPYYIIGDSENEYVLEGQFGTLYQHLKYTHPLTLQFHLRILSHKSHLSCSYTCTQICVKCVHCSVICYSKTLEVAEMYGNWVLIEWIMVYFYSRILGHCLKY